MRCGVVRGDAWPMLPSPCNTTALAVCRTEAVIKPTPSYEGPALDFKHKCRRPRLVLKDAL